MSKKIEKELNEIEEQNIKNLLEDFNNKPYEELTLSYVKTFMKRIKSLTKSIKKENLQKYNSIMNTAYSKAEKRKNELAGILHSTSNKYEKTIDTFKNTSTYKNWIKEADELEDRIQEIIDNPETDNSDDSINDLIYWHIDTYRGLYENNPIYNSFEYSEIMRALRQLKLLADKNSELQFMYDRFSKNINSLKSKITKTLNDLSDLLKKAMKVAYDYHKSNNDRKQRDEALKLKENFENDSYKISKKKQKQSFSVRQRALFASLFGSSFGGKRKTLKSSRMSLNDYISNQYEKRDSEKKSFEKEQFKIMKSNPANANKTDAEIKNQIHTQFKDTFDAIDEAYSETKLKQDYEELENAESTLGKVDKNLGKLSARSKAKAQTEEINKKKKSDKHNKNLLKTIGSLITATNKTFFNGLSNMLKSTFHKPTGFMDFLKTSFKLGLAGFGVIQLSKLIRFFMKGHDFSNEQEVRDILGPMWGDLLHYVRHPIELCRNIFNKFKGKKEVQQAANESNSSLKDYMKNLFYNSDAIDEKLSSDTSDKQSKLQDFFGGLSTSVSEVMKTVLDLGKIVISIPHAILEALSTLNLKQIGEKWDVLKKEGFSVNGALDFVKTSFSTLKDAGVSGLKTLYDDAIVSYTDLKNNADKLGNVKTTEDKAKEVLGTTQQANEEKAVIKASAPIEKKQLETEKRILELQNDLKSESLTDEEKEQKQAELSNLEKEISKLNDNMNKENSTSSDTGSISFDSISKPETNTDLNTAVRLPYKTPNTDNSPIESLKDNNLKDMLFKDNILPPLLQNKLNKDAEKVYGKPLSKDPFKALNTMTTKMNGNKNNMFNLPDTLIDGANGLKKLIMPGEDNIIVKAQDQMNNFISMYENATTQEEKDKLLENYKDMQENMFSEPKVENNGSLNEVAKNTSNNVLIKEIDSKIKSSTEISIARSKRHIKLNDSVREPPLILTTGGTNVLNMGAREA